MTFALRVGFEDDSCKLHSYLMAVQPQDTSGRLKVRQQLCFHKRMCFHFAISGYILYNYEDFHIHGVQGTLVGSGSILRARNTENRTLDSSALSSHGWGGGVSYWSLGFCFPSLSLYSFVFIPYIFAINKIHFAFWLPCASYIFFQNYIVNL